MFYYIIKMMDGSIQEEYGDSEQDVREFMARSYPDAVIVSIFKAA
mgnify:CR=1 FL=1